MYGISGAGKSLLDSHTLRSCQSWPLPKFLMPPIDDPVLTTAAYIRTDSLKPCIG
jgi:hypothetical protein